MSSHKHQNRSQGRPHPLPQRFRGKHCSIHGAEIVCCGLKSNFALQGWEMDCLSPWLLGCTSCIVKSFRSRNSFISSPLWVS